MSKKYFGTDGIRGEFGGAFLNLDFIRRLGYAIARYLNESGGAKPKRVIMGRDTRASGKIIEEAISEGLCFSRISIHSLGVLPTPAVARIVRELQADFGIAITASHNRATDNGIKLFSALGLKLDDQSELHLEALLEAEKARLPSPLHRCGSAYDGTRFYVYSTASLLPQGCLKGWKIVVDTAHGATFNTTPAGLRQLGADIVLIGNEPDGHNINAGVGSEYPKILADRVKSERACLGLAHDGDGDRVVFCDDHGSVLDGDEVLALLGLHALRSGKLAKNTVVATVVSNLGLDQALEAAGGRVERVAVGDRHIIEKMWEKGYNFGGESSGHIIFGDYATTGDGLLAAVKLIEVLRYTEQPLSRLRQDIKLFPQEKRSLKIGQKVPFEELPELQKSIRRLEASLTGRSRLLVRYSGTEPKIRLLVEGEDSIQVERWLGQLENTVATHLEVL